MDNLYKDMSPEERKKNREEHVKPLVEAYFVWVKEQMPKTDPSSDTGRALNYSLNQEPYLRTFLENGEVPLDNNDAERSIKKFCVGKKNWQISATKNGAEASGILYSIAEPVRSHGDYSDAPEAPVRIVGKHLSGLRDALRQHICGEAALELHSDDSP